MKLSLLNRLYVGFSIAILLVILIGALALQTFRRQSTEADWVRHTYQVLNQAESIQKLLVDMETGRRGFRATNDRKFLEPYNTALLKIEPTILRLKELLADNSGQLEQLNRVEQQIEALLQYWKELGDDASRYNPITMRAVMFEEKARMDVIRGQINEFLRIENQLLVRREEENRKATNLATVELLLGTLLILAIVIGLIYLILNEFKYRQKAEASIYQNLKELEQLNRVSTEKNWLLMGISTINDSLRGIKEVGSLSEMVLKAIIDYLKLPAGAFYGYDGDMQQLRLEAAVALSADVKQTYKLQEGLVGQAARDKSVWIINDVPASFWTVQAGSGQAVPGQVVYLPLWYASELKGVIELASFRTLGDQHIQLLKSVADNIAVAINAADDRHKVMRLLQEVQENREELENQQEELRQSNEELLRQAEILQSSEEELRIQEEELRQINTELEAQNKAVETARKALILKAQELELTSKYKSEFLANMSHELRTPLNSVLILAKLLSENKVGNLTNKQIEYANTIHKSGTNLLDLINDILDLSKIEAGKVEMTIEDVSIKSIVSDTSQLFDVIADEKGVQLINHVADSVPATIRTDKQRLEQVIRNLLSNAFKFTPRNGSVTLSFDMVPSTRLFSSEGLMNAKHVLAISVTDTGVGIPPEKQQIIFEAFQQADGSTNRKYGGTGLGLSISKELVRRLGGEIGLESEVGKGSVFTIYLSVDAPVTSSNAPAANTPSTPALSVSVGTFEQTELPDDRNNLSADDKVMLIIEDDINFARVVQEFARERNYKTIVAIQGEEGLRYARRYKPSAIILDMGLPVLSGWDLLQILASDDILKHIPVHIVSASDDGRLVFNNALTYIRKPVEKGQLEKLFAEIGTHLNADVKKVMVLSGDHLQGDTLKQLIDGRLFDIECDYAATPEEALQMIDRQSYDCIIADIGQDLSRGIAELEALQQALASSPIPVIIYLDKDLTAADERQLTKISPIIIRESALAKDRLMDELKLFLYKVQEAENHPLPKHVHVAVNGSDKSLQGRKVLLVDDDMRNVFALSAFLEEQEMNVITAGDGKEALEQLQDHPDIDIALMDIMMPEMDGYEATRRIRADNRFRHLPVIALTAKAMAGDREKCLEAGASDYITKPVDNTQLVSLMRVWLSR